VHVSWHEDRVRRVHFATLGGAVEKCLSAEAAATFAAPVHFYLSTFDHLSTFGCSAPPRPHHAPTHSRTHSLTHSHTLPLSRVELTLRALPVDGRP
jgi:hypothetical protein